MLISESASQFELYLGARALAVHTPSSIHAMAEAWLSFFEEVQASDTVEEEGNNPDMLLFEVGYREAIAGFYDACFYVSFTRQFVSSEGMDDDAMFQLQWTAEYEPRPELLAFGNQVEWCDSQQAMPWFRQMTLAHPALLAVAALEPKKIEYYLTGV